MSDKKQIEKLNYEQASEKLEVILNSLENNNLELEESIKVFEEGVLLSKHCQKILETTEQKVKGLLSDDSNAFE